MFTLWTYLNGGKEYGLPRTILQEGLEFLDSRTKLRIPEDEYMDFWVREMGRVPQSVMKSWNILEKIEHQTQRAGKYFIQPRRALVKTHTMDGNLELGRDREQR